MQTNWVGTCLAEGEGVGESRAAYGKYQLEGPSVRLTAEFGKGFDLPTCARCVGSTRRSQFERRYLSNWAGHICAIIQGRAP